MDFYSTLNTTYHVYIKLNYLSPPFDTQDRLFIDNTKRGGGSHMCLSRRILRGIDHKLSWRPTKKSPSNYFSEIKREEEEEEDKTDESQRIQKLKEEGGRIARQGEIAMILYMYIINWRRRVWFRAINGYNLCENVYNAEYFGREKNDGCTLAQQMLLLMTDASTTKMMGM